MAVNVVAAVIKRNDKVFATQRGYGEFKGGWEFPGGKIEKGETQSHALKRELKEETGLDIVEIIPGLGRDKVYLSPGMTDESVNLVYCTCDGELSKDGLEEDEDLEPLLISKEEAKAILQSDSKIDIKCLMVLQSFININIDI